jgi:hypothetical protein
MSLLSAEQRDAYDSILQTHINGPAKPKRSKGTGAMIHVGNPGDELRECPVPRVMCEGHTRPSQRCGGTGAPTAGSRRGPT